MFRKNNAQVSIEFIVILTFGFVLIGLIMSVLGLFSVDLKDNEIKKQRDDFAQSVISEFELATQVEKGYSRTFTINRNRVDEFNVTFIDRYLVLQSVYSRTGGDLNYYLLPEGVKYNWTKDGMDNMFVTIYTEPEAQNLILLLN